MTTWHAEESLEDALAFALTGAWPSEDYAESCRAVVAVCVGNPTWAHTVREAFRDSAAFVAAWSAASE